MQIAMLCVGHVEQLYPPSMLTAEGWDNDRPPPSGMIYDDTWGQTASLIDGPST